MPRGYLKHCQEIGRKNARGGSSSHSKNQVKKCKQPPETANRIWHRHTADDFVISTTMEEQQDHEKNQRNAVKDRLTKTESSYPKGECQICLEEEVPLIALSTACAWHASACYKCLRNLYVVEAQINVSSYPLVCYHPHCKRPIKWGQLHKHNLITSPEENKKHHEMVDTAKKFKQLEIYKARFATIAATRSKVDRVIACPHCDFPSFYTPKKGDEVYDCRWCNERYLVSPDYATIAALERCQGTDSIGIFDGWGRCPKCGILISKGNGCNHIRCGYCAHSFDWSKVVMKHARVPEQQIHLWW